MRVRVINDATISPGVSFRWRRHVQPVNSFKNLTVGRIMLSGKNLTMVESDEFSFLVSDVDMDTEGF
jgi:hypothetical protein